MTTVTLLIIDDEARLRQLLELERYTVPPAPEFRQPAAPKAAFGAARRQAG